MKYRPTPLERELAVMSDADRRTLVAGLLLETMQTRGFQVVTGILRKLEAQCFTALRFGAVPAEKVGKVLGRIEAITEIRESLNSLLPEIQRSRVDWCDDEEEAYVNVDGAHPQNEDIG
jgi:hypothetical protein